MFKQVSVAAFCLAIVLALTVVGGSVAHGDDAKPSAAASKLIGSWVSKPSQEAIEKAKKEAKDDPSKAMMAGMMDKMSLTLSFENASKLKMNLDMGAMNMDINGTWKIKSEADESVALEIVLQKPGSGETKTDEMRIEFSGDDKMRVVPKDEAEAESMKVFGGEGGIVFERVKS
jgi:hypothetical protein